MNVHFAMYVKIFHILLCMSMHVHIKNEEHLCIYLQVYEKKTIHNSV